MEERKDEHLVSDYLEGDESALVTLVDRYLTDIYNFAYKLTNDQQAAEDITQESFIKAWKHVRRYRPGRSFRAWLFTIARNTAIDWLRQKKALPFSSFETAEGENAFVDALADQEALPEQLLSQAENEQYVAALLAGLHPNYRNVLELRYKQGLTFADIGAMLKKPLHTVKSQHRRALVALRRITSASV